MAKTDDPNVALVRRMVAEAKLANSMGPVEGPMEDEDSDYAPQPLLVRDIPRAKESGEVEPAIVNWCAGRDQSDTDNACRLIAHVGVDLLVMTQEKAKSPAFGVWTGTHWDFATGNPRATALAQHIGDRIGQEPLYMRLTASEQRLIEAAKEAEEKDEHQRTEADKMLIDRAEKARTAFRARAGQRLKFGVSSKNSSRIKAMLEQAAPHLMKPASAFNADHFKVALAGHTLEFVYGPEKVLNPDFEREDAPADAPEFITEQRAKVISRKGHKREDLITEVIPTPYRRGAACPLWTAFLEEFLPDPEVRKLVQVSFGLGLLGVTVQHLFFHYGSGANGKSVALEVACRVLGGNAVTLPSESFFGQAGQGGGATPDMARLNGKKFLRVQELPQGEPLRTDLVKKLTGGEAIAVRDLFSGYFDFLPIFVAHMSGNGYPRITDLDEGIWRRPVVVTWPVTIPEERRRNFEDVVSEFEPEHSGILNWMIEGALTYLREGLKIPEAAKEATRKFRDEMDPTALFVSAHVKRKHGAKVTAREFYNAYVAWANASAARAISETAFGKIMGKKFDRLDGRVREYVDIELVDVPEATGSGNSYPEGYGGH